jgi:predicted dinucleotide-binding enzyme
MNSVGPTIGILGSGRMGTALARLLAGAGYRVLLANSRGPHTLADQVRELGALAAAGDRADVVEAADIVVLATRWEQTPRAVEGVGPWDGKIVVDTTNNRFGPRPDQVYDLGGRSSSEVVAGLVPGARVVKAFNHAPITALAEIGSSADKALFVAGDDDEAKATVARLIRDIGGVAIDTGTRAGGGRLQATGGPLAGHGRLLGEDEARRALEAARNAARSR